MLIAAALSIEPSGFPCPIERKVIDHVIFPISFYRALPQEQGLHSPWSEILDSEAPAVLLPHRLDP